MMIKLRLDFAVKEDEARMINDVRLKTVSSVVKNSANAGQNRLAAGSII